MRKQLPNWILGCMKRSTSFFLLNFHLNRIRLKCKWCERRWELLWHESKLKMRLLSSESLCENDLYTYVVKSNRFTYTIFGLKHVFSVHSNSGESAESWMFDSEMLQAFFSLFMKLYITFKFWIVFIHYLEIYLLTYGLWCWENSCDEHSSKSQNVPHKRD